MTNINIKQYVSANVLTPNATIPYVKNYDASVTKYAKCNVKKSNIIKYLMFLLIFCIFFSILLNPNKYIASAKNAIFLWGNSVVPALFPFMFLTKILFEIMPKNAKSPALFIFFLSAISGYPISSKLLSGYIQNGELSKTQTKKIFTFTSTSGPIFVIGTIGALFFNSIKLGIVIYLVHIISALLTGLCFGAYNFRHKKIKHLNKNSVTTCENSNTIRQFSPQFDKNGQTMPNTTPHTSFKNAFNNANNTSKFSKTNENENITSQATNENDNITPPTKDALSNSIYSSISSILLVGAYIMIFYILFDVLCASHFVNLLCHLGSLLQIPKELMSTICSGIFELTRGASEISQLTVSPLTASLVGAFVSFSGLCILLQQYTFLRPTGISFSYIFLTKLTHAIITFALLYPIFSLFNCF